MSQEIVTKVRWRKPPSSKAIMESVCYKIKSVEGLADSRGEHNKGDAVGGSRQDFDPLQAIGSSSMVRCRADSETDC